MAEEEWEWVHSPDHCSPGTKDDDDDGYGEIFGRDNSVTTAPSLSPLHTNTRDFSENLSSTASSPILKNNISARVMAKECLSALDSLHHSVSEWIEPQLVFTKPHEIISEGFDIHKVIMRLQNLCTAKSLVALLLDSDLCDAVMRNKAFQELASQYTDGVNNKSEGQNVLPASDSSFGRKVYTLVKEKLIEALDILLSLSGTHIIETSVVDNIHETTKSCILLVAVLVVLVIGKRSEEGCCLPHTL